MIFQRVLFRESFLRRFLQKGVDCIFPHPPPWIDLYPMDQNLCCRCGYPFESPRDQKIMSCANCERMEWFLEGAYSVYRMKGDPRRSILEFKYEGKFYWRRRLGEALEEGFHQFFQNQKWDALVPVPLYRKKERKRGFNQAEEIACVLSDRIQIPIWKALSRERETLAQVNQDREARLENLKDAFQLIARFDVRDCNLLIIDDVLTTGTTANECARVLREAGARKVAVLTVARGV